MEMLRRRGESCRAVFSLNEAHRSPVLAHADDLGRDVYCILGMPIDAVDMPTALRKIAAAAADAAPYLISTPNLNYLVNSLTDAEFRQSLLDSDLCSADGMPIVWIARFLGLPITTRVSGSDTLDALKSPDRRARKLKVFLFGGAEGVAAAAATKLNSGSGGLSCVGTFNPGFCPVDQMSREEIVDTINASGADILIVSLGAEKGQLWLHRNHTRLKVPVRAHFGAALNFEAGTVQRAPSIFRASGFEWLWRIKQEPHLWRRYWHDGRVLLRLIVGRVLPLALAQCWHRIKSKCAPRELKVITVQNHDSVKISLCGDATKQSAELATTLFRETLTAGIKSVVIDLSAARVIDQRFFGLLLMLRKYVKAREIKLTFVGVSPAMNRLFRRNEIAFLLSSNGSE